MPSLMIPAKKGFMIQANIWDYSVTTLFSRAFVIYRRPPTKSYFYRTDALNLLSNKHFKYCYYENFELWRVNIIWLIPSDHSIFLLSEDQLLNSSFIGCDIILAIN